MEKTVRLESLVRTSREARRVVAMMETITPADIQRIFEERAQELMLGRLTDFMYGKDAQFNALAREMGEALGIDSRLAGTRLYHRYKSVLHRMQTAGPSAPATTVVYALADVDSMLQPSATPEQLIDKLFACGGTNGLVGPPESGKSLFVLMAAACVATGKPFFGRKVRRGLVVYLCGEGHLGIDKRLQAIEHHHRLGLAGAPLVVSKAGASFLDSAEVERIRTAIADAEKRYDMPLSLLVVDTLARFISPGNDNQSQDMGAFLSAVDALRGNATSIVCHHPGHAAARGRGSSSWLAGIDSEFVLAANADVITLTCTKMKDGERPPPFSFRIQQAPTRYARDDGSTINSVVLEATDTAVVIPKPSGKNQSQLLGELEKRPDVWTDNELREMGRRLGMSKSSARTAVLGLRQLGYLVGTVGGSRLAGTEGTERVVNSNPSRTFGDGKDGGYVNTPVPSPVPT